MSRRPVAVLVAAVLGLLAAWIAWESARAARPVQSTPAAAAAPATTLAARPRPPTAAAPAPGPRAATPAAGARQPAAIPAARAAVDRRPGALTGRVVDVEGAPAVVGLVVESIEQRDHAALQILLSLRDGTFHFKAIPPGRYRLKTADPVTRTPVYSESFAIRSGVTTALPTWTLDPAHTPGRTLSGTVLLRDAPDVGAAPMQRKVGGIELRALGDDGSAARCTTDTAGRFRFTGLEEGQYTVFVDNLHYGAERTYRYPAGVRGVTVIAVRGQARVEGTVHDANGKPVRMCKVTARIRHGAQTFRRWGTTVKGGHFHTGELPPGDYEFVFTARGFAPQTVPRRVTDRAEQTLRVVLRRK